MITFKTDSLGEKVQWLELILIYKSLIYLLLLLINPSDLVAISGAYRSRATLPFVPGFEGVGIVESVGPGVQQSLLGHRVLPLGSSGAWQDVKVTE